MDDQLLNIKYHIILHNKNSMTACLSALGFTLKVIIIPSESNCGQYNRLVVLTLEDIPVIIAKSTTSINDSLFYEILQSSQDEPIGIRLFGNSDILRSKLELKQVSVGDVNDKEISKGLSNIAYLDELTRLDVRISKFTFHMQSMMLYEYVLPSIKMFLV